MRSRVISQRHVPPGLPELWEITTRLRRSHISVALLCALVGVTGCRTTASSQRASSYDSSAAAQGSVVDSQSQGTKPVILVKPVMLDLEQIRDGVMNTQEMTELLIQEMVAHGIDATRWEHDTIALNQTLACTVSRLDYVKRRGYPRRTIYQAQLTC